MIIFALLLALCGLFVPVQADDVVQQNEVSEVVGGNHLMKNVYEVNDENCHFPWLERIEIPIVFHQDYDISCMGIENFHPFDSKKYGRVQEYLIKNTYLSKSFFYAPKAMVTDDELLKVHTQDYLDSLSFSSVVAKIAELGALAWLPNFIVQRVLLNPMRWATAGTLLATDLAVEHGCAINLAGGYHHAKSDCGSGFCVYADIPLAAKNYLEKYPNKKVLIVDLDAHQGNGHEAICGLWNDNRVAIFDIYNKCIYPGDVAVKKFITYDHPIQSLPAGVIPGVMTSKIQDDAYLALLKDALPKAIEEFKPDLIIYNAGTDILSGDQLGCMDISAQGIVERDEFVFKLARKKENPIALVMVLSGGYTQESAQVIGQSTKNLLDKALLKPVKTKYRSKIVVKWD